MGFENPKNNHDPLEALQRLRATVEAHRESYRNFESPRGYRVQVTEQPEGGYQVALEQGDTSEFLIDPHNAITFVSLRDVDGVSLSDDTLAQRHLTELQTLIEQNELNLATDEPE